MTRAQVIFKEGNLLTSRPSGMDFDSYKAALRLQNRIISKLFRHKPSRVVAGLMPIRAGYNLH